MALPDHVLLVTRGRLPGNEEWSTGLRFGTQDGPYTGLDLQAFCEAAMTAWGTFQQGTAMLRTGVTIDNVAGYVYGGGVLVEQAVSTAAPITSTGTVTLPNQCALVVSLRTGVPGRRSRGRCYLPALGLGIQAGNVFASTQAQVYANAFTAMLEQLNASLTLALRSALAAAVVSQVGPGIRNEITSVEVGNVVDTQRRRRESTTEARSTSNVDYAGV